MEWMWVFIVLLSFSKLNVGIYVDEPLTYGTFPPNFMWAAASSAYQIEGGWNAEGFGFTNNNTIVLNMNFLL